MKDRRLPLRIGAAVLLAAAIVWALTHRWIFDAGTIASALKGLGIWAPAGFVALYAAGALLFFPGALLSLAGGALFGPLWGTLWNLLGALFGATLAFLIARMIGAEWIGQRLGGRLRRVVDGVAAEGWRFVALMRLVPLVPFSLLNYALGLTGIGLPTYVVTSAVCMVPGAVAYTWLGYAGRSAVSGDSAALRYGLLALGVLAAIAFLPRLFRRFRSVKPAWTDAVALQHRLAAGDAVCVVDVRQPEEFFAPPGRLPGAINIPLADLSRRTAELAALGRPIVLVCKTDRRSLRAATELAAAGIREVTVLRDGVDGWHRRGLALE